MKQLVTLQPIVMQFVLEKVYYREEQRVYGSFYLQPNKPLDIASITIQITQTLKISKTETETISLGKQTYRKILSLGRFEKHEESFDIALSFPRVTKRERKSYKGDLWPLNKATDKAKKQLYIYKVVAEVKLKGQRKPVSYEEVIKVE